MVALSANIQFGGAAGASTSLVNGVSTTLSNVNDVNVDTWEWTLLAKPAASTHVLGVISNLASFAFIPDCVGTWRFQLTIVHTISGATATDRRTGSVLTSRGWAIPAAGQEKYENAPGIIIPPGIDPIIPSDWEGWSKFPNWMEHILLDINSNLASGGGGSRKRAVIDIVDPTAVPPTEVLGDRYILNNIVGIVDPDWDGASQNDIVEFDGIVWVASITEEGDVAYVDDQNLDALFVDDGTPQWELRSAGGSVEWGKNIIVYVDSVNGNDGTADGTVELPYQTLPVAVASIADPGDMAEYQQMISFALAPGAYLWAGSLRMPIRAIVQLCGTGVHLAGNINYYQNPTLMDGSDWGSKLYLGSANSPMFYFTGNLEAKNETLGTGLQIEGRRELMLDNAKFNGNITNAASGNINPGEGTGDLWITVRGNCSINEGIGAGHFFGESEAAGLETSDDNYIQVLARDTYINSDFHGYIKFWDVDNCQIEGDIDYTQDPTPVPYQGSIGGSDEGTAFTDTIFSKTGAYRFGRDYGVDTETEVQFDANSRTSASHATFDQVDYWLVDEAEGVAVDSSGFVGSLAGVENSQEVAEAVDAIPLEVAEAETGGTGFVRVLDSLLDIVLPDMRLRRDGVTPYTVFVGGKKFTISADYTCALPSLSAGERRAVVLDIEDMITPVLKIRPSIKTALGSDILVAQIYYDGVDWYVSDLRSPAQGHLPQWLDKAKGSKILSGGKLIDFSLGSDNDPYVEVGMEETGFTNGVDEVYVHDRAADWDWSQLLYSLNTRAEIPVFLRTGTDIFDPIWQKQAAGNVPFLYAAQVEWNEYLGGSWARSLVTDGDYVVVHILQVNDPQSPFIALAPAKAYSSLLEARQETLLSVQESFAVWWTPPTYDTWGTFPFSRVRSMARLILRCDSAYSNTYHGVWVDYADMRHVDSGRFEFASSHSALTGLNEPKPDNITIHPFLARIRPPGVTLAGTAFWQANSPYALGDFARSTAGDEYECTIAGTSAGSEPSPWNTTIGGPTPDNTVTWTRVYGSVVLGVADSGKAFQATGDTDIELELVDHVGLAFASFNGKCKVALRSGGAFLVPGVTPLAAVSMESSDYGALLEVFSVGGGNYWVVRNAVGRWIIRDSTFGVIGEYVGDGWVGGVNDHLVSIDATGMIQDSGSEAADFATATAPLTVHAQTIEPELASPGDSAIWVDTTGPTKVYLVYQLSTGPVVQVKVELT